VLRLGLTSRRLSFDGEFYKFKDVPIEIEPLQKPHPTFWSGVGTPDGAETAARNGFHIVANAQTSQIRTMTDRYRATLQQVRPDRADQAVMGLCRFVIMAETDEEALTAARRAYPKWHAHFHHLYHLHGRTAMLGDRPPEFDQIKDGGRGIAGSPESVAQMIKAQMAEAGTNYFVAQFAFGDLTLAEILRTVDLFVRRVMPALQKG
jgi:alkanesulfonate monooxygenase SsuD/methylene tetrahydromethanopterin reductase-like flavin-dependent oxidoreductase (luciferase family)